MNERIWTLAEQNMARRERTRLIRKGTISFRGLPNVLVKRGCKTGPMGWAFPSLKAE